MSEAYEFEEFRLDAMKRRLTKNGGELVQIAPKAFDTLLHLIRNPGKVLEKEELMQAVWADTSVEENNLNQSISAIRRALGENREAHRFVVTVPGRGYKFVAPVRVAADETGITERPKVKPSPDEVGPNPPLTPDKNRTRNLFLVVGAAAILLAGLLGTFLLTREPNTRSTKSIRTLTVLPFKPLVEENRNEALELGMADTLIAKLSRGEDIAVRPLESVRRLAKADKDAVAIGRELQTEAVLEGSIQMAGERLRITTRLIRISDGKQLWAGQFNERLTDIFAVQDSISEKVATALEATLKGKRAQTSSVEAYNLYVQGRYHAAKVTRDETEKAIELYNQATALDPNYALPYVGLSRAYRSFALTSDFPSNETMPKAKAAALRALELDETEPEAHTALGLIAFLYDWDWAAAEQHYLRALDLDPNNPSSHTAYAHLLSNTGRHDEALAEARRARELNPLTLMPVEGQFLHYAGKTDEALQRLKQMIEAEPDAWLPHLFISRVYEEKGMHTEAIDEAKKARDLSRVNSESIACIGYSLARSGDLKKARDVIDELKQLSESRYIPSYNFALVYAGLGDNAEALDSLEKAFAEKDVRMVFLKIEPKWNALRSEPRFIELMRRMNFS